MREDRAERAFLRGLANRPAPAVVLGSGIPHTLGFVRSLGRAGIPVAAVLMEPGARLWSRYCRLERTVPGADALLAFLDRIGAAMSGRGVLLPAGDSGVLFMLEHRARLARHFRFVLAETAVVGRLADKRLQYDCAAQHGVPVPRTYCPSGEDDVARIAAEIRYPCLVKPAYSHLWREYRRQAGLKGWDKAAEVRTGDALRATCRRMGDGGVPLLVQERIEGPESRLYSLYAYLDRRSVTRAAFVLRKQRQWPPEYGSGSYSVSARQDQVTALGAMLLEGVGYQGIANVEFKHDARDDAFKLIEVNVRCGNRIALAAACGVDFPLLAYRDTCGEPAPPDGDYPPDVWWIDLLYDLAALPHYRRTEGLSALQWIRQAAGAHSHAYWAADDVTPFVVHAGRAAWAAVASALR